MSKCADEHQVKEKLGQLRCHFTWQLLIEDSEVSDLEERISEEILFLETSYNVGIHNLLAYVKHLQGKNEDALECLKEGENLCRTDQADEPDVRSLVTWGNYAWVYYHMGRWEDTQKYLDKVQEICKRFDDSSCYRVECPEMDCVEGWALLKCGIKHYERAKACFQKALEVDPENPEFNTGYAIVTYRLDYSARCDICDGLSLPPLRKAISLNPQDGYLKALLALKLQDMGEEAEGEKYLEEALSHGSSQTYVFRYAAKFYRRQGRIDEALMYLKKALKATPKSAFLHHQMGLCYRDQMIQIKKSSNRQPRDQSRRDVDRLIRLAIDKFQTATTLKPMFEIAYVHLARTYIKAGDNEKAEDIFQKVLHMTPAQKSILQSIHFYYAQFLQVQKQSEVDAIEHYLKVIDVGKKSFISGRSIDALNQLFSERPERNASDPVGLKLRELMNKWEEVKKNLGCNEQALAADNDYDNDMDFGL
ncbi:interferon-induced protein with tetratricopeptide repeats 1-like isoform X2 [Ochotona princeps]|uniref:interferon-induced protein with tetratricopeptide repeats 1-like isoform X1 n=1 Tax=Ochotona princeps TaxID=9978 RepID=UPI0027154303|nr:interferon-induced protein with tetratricopeptide repeats 1-like isoform X1 [Ochotona princeps]XP_058527087.1 interferon-induced protein with tetratricopeptide repeats 1-like isoform X2 [Ochotona princeps]